MIKTIIISVLKTMWYDLKSNYNYLYKPKDLMNILFWLLIVELFTQKYTFAIITLILYFGVYIWKIIKQGDWRKMERDKYK